MTLFVVYLIPVACSGEKKVFAIDTWCWTRRGLVWICFKTPAKQSRGIFL